MDYEVELKYAIPNAATFQKNLAGSGFQFVSTSPQVDIYFQHPSRDFAVTDEAFRVRFDDQQGFLTYKGPLADAIAKTRKEIEIPFHPDVKQPDKIMDMLIHLGFRKVMDVKKIRSTYQTLVNQRELHLCFDQVEGLGCFVELEMLATAEEKDDVRDLLLRKAADLNLTQIERRSYLRLLLAKQQP